MTRAIRMHASVQGAESRAAQAHRAPGVQTPVRFSSQQTYQAETVFCRGSQPRAPDNTNCHSRCPRMNCAWCIPVRSVVPVASPPLSLCFHTAFPLAPHVPWLHLPFHFSLPKGKIPCWSKIILSDDLSFLCPWIKSRRAANASSGPEQKSASWILSYIYTLTTTNLFEIKPPDFRPWSVLTCCSPLRTWFPVTVQDNGLGSKQPWAGARATAWTVQEQSSEFLLTTDL